MLSLWPLRPPPRLHPQLRPQLAQPMALLQQPRLHLPHVHLSRQPESLFHPLVRVRHAPLEIALLTAALVLQRPGQFGL